MSKRRQNWMRQADTLFSRYIRGRDGSCQAAGWTPLTCAGSLQCCHIFGRGELILRTDETNAITMCQAHHVYFTHRPAEWWDFIDSQYPGLHDTLRRKARLHREAPDKIDWQAEVARLEALT